METKEKTAMSGCSSNRNRQVDVQDSRREMLEEWRKKKQEATQNLTKKKSKVFLPAGVTATTKNNLVSQSRYKPYSLPKPFQGTKVKDNAHDQQIQRKPFKSQQRINVVEQIGSSVQRTSKSVSSTNLVKDKIHMQRDKNGGATKSIETESKTVNGTENMRQSRRSVSVKETVTGSVTKRRTKSLGNSLSVQDISKNRSLSMVKKQRTLTSTNDKVQTLKRKSFSVAGLHANSSVQTDKVKKMERKSMPATHNRRSVQNDGQRGTSEDKNMNMCATDKLQINKTPGGGLRSVRFDIITPQSSHEIKTPKSNKKFSFVTPKKTEKSLRQKLNQWLDAKGKTPSRFRHLHCFGAHLSAKKDKNGMKNVSGGLTADDLAQQQLFLEEENDLCEESDAEKSIASELQDLLFECSTLLDADCPVDSISQWLDEISNSFPDAKETACYWICKARVVEKSCTDGETLNVFEEAARHRAQPPEEIAEALREFTERMIERIQTRKRKANHSLENIFESSSIKYCLMETTTPFFKRIRTAMQGTPTPKSVLTPVRRSTRRSCADLPLMLKDHDRVFDDLNEVPVEDMNGAFVRTNKALLAEFEEEADD